LARGYQWFGELAAETAVSTKQTAAREGVSDSYVRHLVPLALLAPAIVDGICAGRQSVCSVDHTITDLTSIPRFMEDNWSLGRIGGGSYDAIAGPLSNLFDFSGRRRTKRLFLDLDTGEQSH